MRVCVGQALQRSTDEAGAERGTHRDAFVACGRGDEEQTDSGHTGRKKQGMARGTIVWLRHARTDGPHKPRGEWDFTCDRTTGESRDRPLSRWTIAPVANRTTCLLIRMIMLWRADERGRSCPRRCRAPVYWFSRIGVLCVWAFFVRCHAACGHTGTATHAPRARPTRKRHTDFFSLRASTRYATAPSQ